eukprot:scaffold305513_cov19-Tisochrysis_lutea.AAC.1
MITRVLLLIDSANGWVDENSGKSWAGTGPRLLSQLPNVRFVFPTAPQRPCTLKGQVLTGWWVGSPGVTFCYSSPDYPSGS